MTIRNVRAIYVATALVSFKALVLFVLLNLGIYAVYGVKNAIVQSRAERRPESRNSLFEYYGAELMQEAHPGLAIDQIKDLLKGTNPPRRFEYEPFTQFRERPRRGHYINIEESGFRVIGEQGPWPPDPNHFNVFVFGGSSAFGDSVADRQTIPSYLQESLRSAPLERTPCVYNFGRGSYFSSQERALFESLLIEGHVPDMAVFIDGANEFVHREGRPALTKLFMKSLSRRQDPRPNLCSQFLDKMPLSWAVKSVWSRVERLRLNREAPRDMHAPPEHKTDADLDSEIASVLRRYLNNKKMIEVIADGYGTQPVFFWQPMAIYKHDLKYQLFYDETKTDEWRGALMTFIEKGYPEMAKIVEHTPLGDNFIWGADLHAHARKLLYVDRFHYNPGFSKGIAHFIYTTLQARDLLPQLDQTASTGG